MPAYNISLESNSNNTDRNTDPISEYSDFDKTNKFISKHHGLSLSHLNACSLYKHMDEAKHLFEK